MTSRVFEFRYDRWCGWLLGAMGLGRRFARVVTDDVIEIRMGWGFRSCVPRDRIVGVDAAERPFIGWGVHGWRGRWLVNGSLEGIVALSSDPPRRCRVIGVPLRLRTAYLSLVDPAGFETALASSPAVDPLT